MAQALNSAGEPRVPDAKPSGVIEPVQYLRALAALMVVFSHANDQLRTPGLGYTPELGHFGVDLFFVISGFIMLVITEQREQTPHDFLLSRILRVAPNYWFYTTLVAVLAVAAPSVFRATAFTLPHYLQSLLFIAHENPADPGSTSPLLKLGWTLNYEMFFYVVFTAAIALSFARRLLITTAALGSLIVLGWLFAPTDPVANFYTRDIMLEFLFGMGIGWLYLHGRTGPRSALYFFGFGILCLLWANVSAGFGVMQSSVRGLVWGVPAAGVLFLALGLQPARGWVGRVLKGLGDASYTIYLFHLFPLSGLRLIWLKIGLATGYPLATYVFVLLALVVVATSGYAAYWLIERPATRLAHSLRQRLLSADRKRVTHPVQ